MPEQVAGLGVDNDEVRCGLSPPPMSSVILNPRHVGRDGAALLARIAERTGFEPAYLSAVSRANEGLVPSEYRRRHGRGVATDSR